MESDKGRNPKEGAIRGLNCLEGRDKPKPKGVVKRELKLLVTKTEVMTGVRFVVKEILQKKVGHRPRPRWQVQQLG